MPQTRKELREEYNAKTYRQFKWRVRRKSELCEKIEGTISTPGASLNHLITKLLAQHYGVEMPEPWLDKN